MSDIIIDVTGKSFRLSGDIGAIQNNRRAKGHFISIGALFENPDAIILKYDGDNKGEVYKNLKRLLDKHNYNHKQTAQAADFLQDINREEENFSSFSEKARNIRNNLHEGDDFNEFVASVKQHITRDLYTLQLLSAYHLAFAQNACNFSVPGAGKTTIVYAAYAYLKNLARSHDKHIGRMLIICPLAAFAPWKDEYKECFGKEPVVKELVGLNARQRSDHFLSSGETEITLISYQSAASDVDHIKAYLNHHKHKDVMVVLDEAHKIKNTSEDAVWAKAALSLADFAKSRVVLTGTPAPNGYGDLWNLYKFIWPHKNIIKFPHNYLADLSKPDDKKKLIDRISPFFIRIKKDDLGLPDAQYNDPIIVPMATEQRAIYDHIEQKYTDSFMSNSGGVSFTEKLKKAKIIRLRQCLTNPALLQKPLQEYKDSPVIDDREIMGAIRSYGETPNKFIAAGNLAKDIMKKPGADGKVIIWAYFIGNIEGLKEYFESEGIACETLYGATPNENDETEKDVRTRERIIRDFHDDDCPYKVIIANPFAVGESISLHKACHNAIYLEKDFNATNYMQSKDRTHRYGLKEDDIINYYYLLSENSIDATIHDRVLEKERHMLELIESEEIPLFSQNMNDGDDVDDNDIRAIIDDYHARKPA